MDTTYRFTAYGAAGGRKHIEWRLRWHGDRFKKLRRTHRSNLYRCQGAAGNADEGAANTRTGGYNGGGRGPVAAPAVAARRTSAQVPAYKTESLLLGAAAAVVAVVAARLAAMVAALVVMPEAAVRQVGLKPPVAHHGAIGQGGDNVQENDEGGGGGGYYGGGAGGQANVRRRRFLVHGWRPTTNHNPA